jgi:hypothetical protein
MEHEQQPLGSLEDTTGQELGQGHGSSTRIESQPTPLLPTHRFIATVAWHTSPFYSIPLYYLKRRGIFLVLLCMGGIAYLHSAYLFPSDNDLLWTSSSTNSRNINKFSSLEVGHIREPPSFGSAPVNGVDENGFEIVEEPFANKKDDTGRQRNKDGSFSQQYEYGRQYQERQYPRIQFDFEDSPIHTTVPTGDRTYNRLTTVKDMIRHAWFGFVPKMQQDIKSTTQRIEIQGEWIDIMDTLLLASMTNEYSFAKNKVLGLAGSQHVSQSVSNRNKPWRKQGEQGIADTTDKLQIEEQKHIQDDVSDGGGGDMDTQGIRFFETVVRQLGGLLSIYELERVQSNKDPQIMKAAVELGDQLTLAFQGPNRALPASTIFSRYNTDRH